MDIQIDEKGVTFGGHRLRYDAYYFDADEYAELSCGEVLKKMLGQWAAALAGLQDGQTVFLPFSPDDEWVECLRVTQHGDQLTAKYVWVEEGGYSVDVSDLSGFMATRHQIRKESPEVFGEWGKEEFISALLDARVAAA